MAEGFLAKLATGLLRSEDNIVGKLLEEEGRKFLLELVGGAVSPLGVGVSGLLKFIELLEKNQEKVIGGEGLKSTLKNVDERRRYAQSHRQWLEENGWRFDWRSQPRHPAGAVGGGEWIPGRLPYPVQAKFVLSRRVRRQRTTTMRAYKERRRLLGQTRLRPIVSSWGTY